MTVRSRCLLAAAVGLWVAHPLLGQEPARLEVPSGQALTARSEVNSNQKTANTIAEHLRQSGQLRHYNIDVLFLDGTATLRGTVADQPQRDEAVRVVQGVPGVERVLDRLALPNGAAVAQAQAVAQPMLPEPGLPPRGVQLGQGPVGEPMPMFQGPPANYYDLNPPAMPPHAWPTYAPYNNYSRVAYPTAYPYGAWPFIGPMYPFPKIPPGWRSVKLQWVDGKWWFGKTATPYDWWRVRYW